MGDIPIGLALLAGMLAAVNPCGFALLPAYLSFLVLGSDRENRPSRRRAVTRALSLTGAMTAGFVVVFGIFGLAIAPFAGAVQQYLPWFTIVLGILLALTGGWLLAGRTLQLPTLRIGRGPVTGTVPAMVGFGASYAIASLGCTIGPFLGIVVTGFTGSTPLAGPVLFLSYALGMGLVVGVAAVAVALAKTGLVNRLRRVGALLPRLIGGLLVLVGLYVAYYGWYEIRAYNGADVAGDPVIGAADRVQIWLAQGVETFGVLGLGITLVVLVLTAAVLTRLRRSDSRFR